MEARFEGQVRRFRRAHLLYDFERIAFSNQFTCYAATSPVSADPEWSNSSPGEAFGWGNRLCRLQMRWARQVGRSGRSKAIVPLSRNGGRSRTEGSLWRRSGEQGDAGAAGGSMLVLGGLTEQLLGLLGLLNRSGAPLPSIFPLLAS